MSPWQSCLRCARMAFMSMKFHIVFFVFSLIRSLLDGMIARKPAKSNQMGTDRPAAGVLNAFLSSWSTGAKVNLPNWPAPATWACGGGAP